MKKLIVLSLFGLFFFNLQPDFHAPKEQPITLFKTVNEVNAFNVRRGLTQEYTITMTESISYLATSTRYCLATSTYNLIGETCIDHAEPCGADLSFLEWEYGSYEVDCYDLDFVLEIDP